MFAFLYSLSSLILLLDVGTSFSSLSFTNSFIELTNRSRLEVDRRGEFSQSILIGQESSHNVIFSVEDGLLFNGHVFTRSNTKVLTQEVDDGVDSLEVKSKSVPRILRVQTVVLEEELAGRSTIDVLVTIDEVVEDSSVHENRATVMTTRVSEIESGEHLRVEVETISQVAAKIFGVGEVVSGTREGRVADFDVVGEGTELFNGGTRGSSGRVDTVGLEGVLGERKFGARLSSDVAFLVGGLQCIDSSLHDALVIIVDLTFEGTTEEVVPGGEDESVAAFSGGSDEALGNLAGSTSGLIEESGIFQDGFVDFESGVVVAVEGEEERAELVHGTNTVFRVFIEVGGGGVERTREEEEGEQEGTRSSVNFTKGSTNTSDESTDGGHLSGDVGEEATFSGPVEEGAREVGGELLEGVLRDA